MPVVSGAGGDNVQGGRPPSLRLLLTFARGAVGAYVLLLAIGVFASMVLDLLGTASFDVTVFGLALFEHHSGSEGLWGAVLGPGVFYLSLLVGAAMAFRRAQRG